MLDLTQSALAALLLRSFFAGVMLGLFYDILRAVKLLAFSDGGARYPIFLTVMRHIATFVFDVLFCLVFAVSAIAICYAYVEGLHRGMVYLGMAVGLIIYRLTLGRAVAALERRAARLIRCLMRRVARAVAVPIVYLFRRIILLYHLTIGKIIGKIIIRIKDAANRRKNALSASEDGAETGKEELGYGDGGAGYRASGRINFGDH